MCLCFRLLRRPSFFSFFPVGFRTVEWQLLFPRQLRANRRGGPRCHPPLEENERKSKQGGLLKGETEMKKRRGELEGELSQVCPGGRKRRVSCSCSFLQSPDVPDEEEALRF